MFKMTVKKLNGTILDFSQGPSEQFLKDWFKPFEEKGIYGTPEHTVQILISEYIPAVLDEQGNELSSEIHAVYESKIIPAEYILELEDITSEIEAEVSKKAKMEAGKKAREVCTQVLDLVAGENLDKVLTIEQITEMQTVFAPIQQALMSSRPSLAKILITSVQPSELVSSELKAEALELLQGY